MSILPKENQIPYKGFGIGFVKSRKLDSRIMDICSEIYKYVETKEINLLDIVVDRSEGIALKNEVDIGRNSIDKLVPWMRKDFIKVIFVRNIYEITTDKDDLYYFLLRAKDLGVSIHSINKGTGITTNEISDEIEHGYLDF